MFYINELANRLEEELPGLDAVIAIFVDDVSILARDHSIEKATAIAQRLVDIVSAWSKDWKLSLNVEKSQVTLFTNYTKEARLEPSVLHDGSFCPAFHHRMSGNKTGERQALPTKNTIMTWGSCRAIRWNA